MANLKEIRSRIDSTKNTQKITSALKLVSAAKLRRAQQNIVNLRPYAKSLLTLIADIAETQKVTHKLLEKNDDPKTALVLVIASDRGLCGSFNSSIAKFTENFMAESQGKYEKVDFIFVGRKIKEYFGRRNVEPIEYITGLDKDISYDLAVGVAQKAIEAYSKGEYEEISVVYNEFKSAIAQDVVCERILPIDTDSVNSFDGEDDQRFAKDLIFEPSPEQIIEQLLEKHFAVQVYRCMSESVASEHGARMTSMENSTKNAGELIKSLTTTYNKLRQASITKELIEITTGAEALNG
ncbi:MAG: ATP synthase F1 subunit gamma [Bdellovibrionales bacterium]|nr:ATP synthase F1 subunit gamma [Bdellovibrionales bacterium]NQZ17796.1 ATP synthase F1 subunit gamma [Bdellovibrionales bacterium]